MHLVLNITVIYHEWILLIYNILRIKYSKFNFEININKLWFIFKNNRII